MSASNGIFCEQSSDAAIDGTGNNAEHGLISFEIGIELETSDTLLFVSTFSLYNVKFSTHISPVGPCWKQRNLI